MKTKAITALLIFGLVFGLAIFPKAFAAGPRTNNLLIRLYANELTEFADVGTIVDVSDWPGTADFIERWRVDPKVELRSYSELGEMILDMNDQRWPTGWNTPLTYDPRTDSYKHYYDYTDGMLNPDANQRRDWAAREFRKAIAWLTDKERYISEICGGYAYAMETFVPVPALEGYTDYPGLEAKGLLRGYSQSKAMQILDAAGFRNWDGDPDREWKDPGPDMIFGTGDDGSVEELPELKFYIRMDDSQRMRAGILLADELTALNIRVKRIITERSVCWRDVMVLYDFHLYTGGWSLGAVPEWLYTIWGAEYYWAPVGWSTNYDGFCDYEYDTYAYNVYTAKNASDLLNNALLAQERFAELQPADPWWCAAAVKAYKAGWNGIINDVGYGVDNYYSFLMAQKSDESTIDYGFKSSPQALHVISSQWLWDWNALGFVYESLIGRSPFNKAIGVYDYWLATDYTVGTWDGGTKTMVTFTIRSGVTWQDGVPFTPADVVFTYKFTFHCGSGVAWNFAAVQKLNDTYVDGNKVVVKMNVLKPLTGQEDYGMLPIIPKHIWEAKFPNWEDWYNETTGEWAPLSEREVVRNWNYWTEEHPVYNSTNPHPIYGVMTKMIGTGAWVYKSWLAGESLAYLANQGYYKTADSVELTAKTHFWKYMGDVSFNFKVDGTDLTRVLAEFGHTGSGIIDKDCDCNSDNKVDELDHFLVVKNYGRTA